MLSNSWTFRATSQSAPRIFTVAVAVPQKRMLLVVTVAAACMTITLPAADLFDTMTYICSVVMVSSQGPVMATSTARLRGRMASGINSLQRDLSLVVTSLSDGVAIARVLLVSMSTIDLYSAQL